MLSITTRGLCYSDSEPLSIQAAREGWCSLIERKIAPVSGQKSELYHRNECDNVAEFLNENCKEIEEPASDARHPVRQFRLFKEAQILRSSNDL